MYFVCISNIQSLSCTFITLVPLVSPRTLKMDLECLMLRVDLRDFPNESSSDDDLGFKYDFKVFASLPLTKVVK